MNGNPPISAIALGMTVVATSASAAWSQTPRQTSATRAHSSGGGSAAEGACWTSGRMGQPPYQKRCASACRGVREPAFLGRMPITPNFVERGLLRLNQLPGSLLDVLGAAVFRTACAALKLGVFEALAEKPASAGE